MFWSAKQESNLWPLAPKASALTWLSYTPLVLGSLSYLFVGNAQLTFDVRYTLLELLYMEDDLGVAKYMVGARILRTKP